MNALSIIKTAGLGLLLLLTACKKPASLTERTVADADGKAKTGESSALVPEEVATHIETSKAELAFVAGQKSLSPLQLWKELEIFQGQYEQLPPEKFESATRDLLQLRLALAIRPEAKRLMVIASIESRITDQIVRRLNAGSLSLEKAKELAAGYASPVFTRLALVELIGYKGINQSAGGNDFLALKNYSYEKSGGEDNLYSSLPESDTWAMETNKAFFDFTAISDSRRRSAALGAYLVFIERGGDLTRQPLFKHIQEIIPDLVGRPVVVTGNLKDESLDAGDIERLLQKPITSQVRFP